VDHDRDDAHAEMTLSIEEPARQADITPAQIDAARSRRQS
jgi:hypothetical protein